MARKAGAKKQKAVPEKPSNQGIGFFEYLRFGESYTSLILGIIVVIIATALLLSFVHNKNAGNVNAPISQQTQNTIQISQSALDLAKKAPNGTIDGTITTAPTSTIAPTQKPTVVPTVKPTVKPTSPPKKMVTAKKNIVMKKIVKSNPTPTTVPQIITGKDNNIWTVQKGESLWLIAEKKYTSGYNWVDIAKANHLADPSDIHVGDRLILPSVTPKTSTIAVARTKNVGKTNSASSNVQQNTTNNVNKIMGKSYTVEKGDTLWNIAVRAYGDGYKWITIAEANNLTNPGMIFSGNHLKIPRG
jgi:nucleoid-associated protein YgaU